MSAINLTSLVSQPSPTTAAASTITSTFWQKYISERRPEVQQLKDALQSGNLSSAETAYNNLVSLGKTVLGKDNPFTRSDRALDFNAIGGALQSGDLAGAQQAFGALESTFAQKDPPSGPIENTGVNSSQADATVSASEKAVNLIA